MNIKMIDFAISAYFAPTEGGQQAKPSLPGNHAVSGFRSTSGNKKLEKHSIFRTSGFTGSTFST